MNLAYKAERYLEEKTKWLEKKGIEVVVHRDTDRLFEDGCCVGGMFDAYQKKLSVAAGPEIKTKDWLTIFIHEYQHAKQFIAQSQVWLDVCNFYKGDDALGVVFNWLDGNDYPDQIIYKAIRMTQAIELDAEKRTVRELINTGFSNDIDVLNYTKDANGYIYFYNMVYMFRKWFGNNYTESNIVNKCLPDHFNNDYTKIPMEFYRLALKYCYK